MRKLSLNVKKGLLFCVLILVFQICAFSLVTILTIQNAIAVLLAAICFVCIACIRKMLIIKLK